MEGATHSAPTGDVIISMPKLATGCLSYIPCCDDDWPELVMLAAIIISFIGTIVAFVLESTLLTVICGLSCCALIYGHSYVVEHKRLVQMEQRLRELHEEILTLEQHNHSLQAHAEAIGTEVSRLELLNRTLEQSSHAIGLERDALREDRDRVSDELSQLRTAREDLVVARGQLDSVLREVAQFSQQLQTIHREITSTAAERAQVAALIQSEGQHLSRIRAEVQSETGKLARVRSQLETTSNNLAQQVRLQTKPTSGILA